MCEYGKCTKPIKTIIFGFTRVRRLNMCVCVCVFGIYILPSECVRQGAATRRPMVNGRCAEWVKVSFWVMYMVGMY